MNSLRHQHLRRALVRALMLLVAVFFAGSILRDILRYGVNVPFWDQWDFVATLRRVSTGETTWPSALFLSGAGHQLGLQFALSVLAWKLTQMNMVASMVLNWTCALGFCILGMVVTRRTLPPGSCVPWLILGAGSFFVFHPAAYQVWFWGLPLVHLLIPLLFFAGVAAAQSRLSDRTKIVIAAACAFLASFILGSGLLVWFLFPVVLTHYVKRGAFRAERLAVGLYGMLAAVCVVVYGVGILGYRNPAPADGPSGAIVLARFFFAYTGNLVSLSVEPPPVLWAELAGLALTCCFLALAFLAIREFYGRKDWPVIAIWASLGAYSLASGAMVALGRHGFGLVYAVESSRYVLASAFLPLANVALGCVLIRAYFAALPVHRHRYYWTLCGVTALLLICAGFRYVQWPRAIAAMQNSHWSQTSGKVAVVSANVFPLPQLGSIFAQGTREDFLLSANFLNSRGWLSPAMWDDVFVRELASPTRPQVPAYGSVDSVVADGGALQLTGWAYLADRNVRADAVIVLDQSSSPARVLSVVFPSVSRKDVSERLHQQEALVSGWTAEVVAATGAAIRCFAYDAATGQAHLLPAGGSANSTVPPADVVVLGSMPRR